jgi:hypothetical protein
MNLDLTVIPAGQYCDGCPHFERLDYPGFPAGSNAARCKVAGVEHDVCLDDGCKVCGINDATERFDVTVFGLKDGTAELVQRRIEELLSEFNVIVEREDEPKPEGGFDLNSL